MKKYWRQFKRWMKFNPPAAETLEGWSVFSDQFKAKAPIRYFLTDMLPQKVWWPIERRVQSVRQFFRYRLVPRHRYHMMDTGMAPGYNELDKRLLHVSFNALKQFVEVEVAWKQFFCNSDERPNWFSATFGRQSYPEKGIEYLEWEASLSDPQSPDYNPGCERQSAGAIEILSLYAWWTSVYLVRENLEYPEHPDISTSIDVYGLVGLADRTTPEYAEYRQAVADYDAEKAARKEEENIMLLRLMEIRDHLWT